MAQYKSISDIVSNPILGLKAEGPLFVRNEFGIETWQFERDTPEGKVPTGPKMSIIQPRASTLAFNPDGTPLMSADGQWQKRVSQTLANALGLEEGENGKIAELDTLTLSPVTMKPGNEYSPTQIAGPKGKVYVRMFVKVLNGRFTQGTAAYAACNPISDGHFTWKRVEVADPRDDASAEAKVVRMLTGFQVVVLPKETYDALHLTENSRSFKAQGISVCLVKMPDGKTASGLEVARVENRNARFANNLAKPKTTPTVTSGKINIGQEVDGVETPWGNPVADSAKA